MRPHLVAALALLLLAGPAAAQIVNQSAKGRDYMQRAVDSSDLFAEDRNKLAAALANFEMAYNEIWLPVKDWASAYWEIVQDRSGGRLDVGTMKPPIEGIISAHGTFADRARTFLEILTYVDRDFDSQDPKLPYKHDRERLRDAGRALADAQWGFESKVKEAFSAARDRLRSLQSQITPLYDQLAQATEQRSRAQQDLSTAFQENTNIVNEWSALFRRLAELDRECNDTARELLRENQNERTDFRRVTDLENRISGLVREAQTAIGRERTLRDQIKSAFERIHGIEERLTTAQNTEAETRKKLSPLEPDYERALIVNAGLVKVYRD